jgi:hypothetical protein
MNLSESYKKRLQELATIDVTNFRDFSKEEYEQQLEKLGIEKFEDLVGRTVYNIKPVYGEHKVLKWFPERAEYLLFTGGNRVLTNPFNIIPIPEKTEKEIDSEIKWVISKMCAEEKPKSINIKDISVNEKGNLIVVFDLITEDYKIMFGAPGRVDVEVLYEDVVLEISAEKDGAYKAFRGEGKQTILKSTDGNTGGKWDSHAPFISPNYNLNKTDMHYMKKIVERTILSLI